MTNTHEAFMKIDHILDFNEFQRSGVIQTKCNDLTCT